MQKVFLRGPGNGKRQSAEVGERIAGGGAGDIYKLPDQSGQVLKIYKPSADKVLYAGKLEAMLANEPKFMGKASRKDFPLLAWPVSIAEDKRGQFLGFAMPEIDFSNTVSLERMLQARMREVSNLPSFYGYRLLAALNLASIVAELHKIGHHIIDLKPVNCRLHPDKMLVSILDCDGFSINGKGRKRFHAPQFSPEYIAPEASNSKPADLGEEQDLFALATIIFRLANNGLHPFQGQIKKSKAGMTIQAMINQNYYAYGSKPQSGISPAKQSIHESMPADLRDMFDQAFLSSKRPKASKWRDILKNYTKPGGLIRCTNDPEVHAYFDQALGCGWCELEGLTTRPAPKKTRRTSGKSTTRPMPGRTRRRTPRAKSGTLLSSLSNIQGRKFAIAAWVCAFILFLFQYNFVDYRTVIKHGGNSTNSSPPKTAKHSSSTTRAKKSHRGSPQKIIPLNKTGHVTADTNLRTNPGTEFDIILTIPNGTKVKVIGRVESSEWHFVELKDQTRSKPVEGYLFGRYLSTTAKPKTITDTFPAQSTVKDRITNKSKNMIPMNKAGFLTTATDLYKGAGSTHYILMRLPKGTQVQVTGKIENTLWRAVKVESQSGEYFLIGFVNANNIAFFK